ncbi:MAG: DUF4340 domain-containing protein [Gemmatimonadales bacterium]|jgi:hypothetical protein
MSDRFLKILIGVLIVLAVAWAAARFTSGRGGGAETGGFDLALSDEAEVDSVVIATPEDTVRLVADGGDWTVNGYEAMADAGESLERALEEAQIGQLVSRNPENHGRLGVAEDEGRRLTVYADGQAKLSIILGDRARGYREAYIRRPDDDEVYTISGGLISLAGRSVTDWRKKEILSFTRGDIAGIEYTYGDTTFSLTRDSAGVWHIGMDGPVIDEADLSGALSQLAGLRAIGFAADSVADTLTWQPAARVRVVGPGGAVLGDLTFLERAEEVGYYVRRGNSPVVYTVSKYTGDQILKRESDLLPQPEEAGEEPAEAAAEEPGGAMGAADTTGVSGDVEAADTTGTQRPSG